MTSSFSSPKAIVAWVGRTIGTGFGIKIAVDSYNRRADNQSKKVVQKGVNRKILKTETKKIQEKTNGVENPDLAKAIQTESKHDYQETISEHVQTNLELGDTCRGVLQDVKSAGNYPAGAETAKLYLVQYRDRGTLPFDPPTDTGFVLEFKDKNEEILEKETLSTVFDYSDKSKATSSASIKLKNSTDKGTPSSFASISGNLPWHDPQLSVTVTTLNLKTGVIEEKVLSKEETKTFQGVLPNSNYVPVKNPPRDFNITGIVLLLVAFSSLIGFPILKSLKKNFSFQINKKKG